MRCRTCQQRMRRELEVCPHCGGSAKKPRTGITKPLSTLRAPRPIAPQPHISPPLLTLMVVGVFIYCTLWLALWPLTATESGGTDLHFLTMRIGFACACLLPYATWRGWRRCSLLLACGALVVLVMRMHIG